MPVKGKVLLSLLRNGRKGTVLDEVGHCILYWDSTIIDFLDTNLVNHTMGVVK